MHQPVVHKKMTEEICAFCETRCTLCVEVSPLCFQRRGNAKQAAENSSHSIFNCNTRRSRSACSGSRLVTADAGCIQCDVEGVKNSTWCQPKTQRRSSGTVCCLRITISDSFLPRTYRYTWSWCFHSSTVANIQSAHLFPPRSQVQRTKSCKYSNTCSSVYMHAGVSFGLFRYCFAFLQKNW